MYLLYVFIHTTSCIFHILCLFTNATLCRDKGMVLNSLGWGLVRQLVIIFLTFTLSSKPLIIKNFYRCEWVHYFLWNFYIPFIYVLVDTFSRVAKKSFEKQQAVACRLLEGFRVS
jgi:hypothetical protein